MARRTADTRAARQPQSLPPSLSLRGVQRRGNPSPVEADDLIGPQQTPTSAQSLPCLKGGGPLSGGGIPLRHQPYHPDLHPVSSLRGVQRRGYPFPQYLPPSLSLRTSPQTGVAISTDSGTLKPPLPKGSCYSKCRDGGIETWSNGFSRPLTQAQNDRGGAKPFRGRPDHIQQTATPVLGRSSRPPKNKANDAGTVLFHIRPGGTPT